MTGFVPNRHTPFHQIAPTVIPDLPAHVWPNNSEDEKTSCGLVWCMRCGYLLWTAKKGDISDYDCRAIRVTLR